MLLKRLYPLQGLFQSVGQQCKLVVVRKNTFVLPIFIRCKQHLSNMELESILEIVFGLLATLCALVSIYLIVKQQRSRGVYR